MNAPLYPFNSEKFEEVILYLLVHAPKQTISGKKKLAKLLYFADFNYFEAFEEPITGATYRALPMGPVPKELESTLAKLEGKKVTILKKSIGLENDICVYKLAEEPNALDFSKLSSKEKKVLDKVIKDYGHLPGKALENITHAEAPYCATAPGEYIHYELAFYRGKTKEQLVGA